MLTLGGLFQLALRWLWPGQHLNQGCGFKAVPADESPNIEFLDHFHAVVGRLPSHVKSSQFV